MDFKDVNVGDEVFVDCNCNHGSRSIGWHVVQAVRHKIDKVTKTSYRLLKVKSSWYEDEFGTTITPPLLRHLTDKKISTNV